MLGADEPLQRSGTVTVGGQPHTVTDGRVKVPNCLQHWMQQEFIGVAK